MEHVETVIIGAGQAGLATGYHLQRRGRAVRHPRRAASGSATTGASSGTPSSSTPPPSTTACPGMPFPAKKWSFPGKDQVADYLEAYAAPLRAARSGSASGSQASAHAEPASGSSSPPTTGRLPLRQRGGRHRHLRPHAEGPDCRRGARPVDPAAALERVPPARPAPRRPGARRRRIHSGTDIAYEVAADPPDDPGRPRLRADPGPAGVPADAGGLPGAALRVAARPHPAYADRPQGDGGDPLPRRPDAAGQARRPRRARRRRNGSPPGRGGPRRAAGARRRHASRRRQRRLGDRLPAGLRLDRAARSSARTAGRASTAASSTTPPACSSAACRFQYAFRSMLLARRAAATRSTSPAGSSSARHATVDARREPRRPARPAVREYRPTGGTRDGRASRTWSGRGTRLRAGRLGRRVRQPGPASRPTRLERRRPRGARHGRA